MCIECLVSITTISNRQYLIHIWNENKENATGIQYSKNDNNKWILNIYEQNQIQVLCAIDIGKVHLKTFLINDW